MAESLINLDVLRDFISLIIWTGQVADERPSSAIIVAPPGAGKTTLLESFQCDFAEFVGDLTARQLSGIARNKQKVTHILLGDMLSIFGHKTSTVQLTMRLLSQMTGEKLLHDPWTGEAIKPREIGLVTAIPPDDINNYKLKKHIASGGFASRFLIARYSYRPSTIAAIHDFIAKNGYSLMPGKSFAIENPGCWKIGLSNKLSERIKTFSLSLRADPLGFRAHRHIRALVKANARRNQRNNATEKDLQTVEGFCDLFTRGGKEL